MAKSKKSSSGSIVESLFGLSILLAIWIGISARNTVVGVVVFMCCILAIFVGVTLYRNARNGRLVASGIDIVDKMTGEEFEKFLLAHFKKLGYQGNLTPATADYGADLVLESDGRKVVAQAKRWKCTVGIEAVQQIVGAIKHYDATEGMVITSSTFTENAYKLAKSNGVELWDRDKLVEVMGNANRKELASGIASGSNPATQTGAAEDKIIETEACPRCRSTLMLRNGKRGEFWGCSGFPKCRFTRDYV